MKMKKIIYVVMAAMTVVSCCKVDNSFYFDSSDKRVVDDATAEFDTLSYAVGMNIGLGLKNQPSGLTFNKEALLSALSEELMKEGVDYQFLEENKERMNNFAKERMQPRAMAKFRNSLQQNTSNTANVVETPLFDDEFTEEGVSEMFGHDIAGYICTSAYPINIHWFRTAVNETFDTDTQILHDSLLRLSVMQMRSSLQRYHVEELPKYTAEASRKWLDYVAQQRGVNMMVVEGDTLYFRVDVAGNGVKPRSLNDTIALSYDLYTRGGKLIESLSKREAIVREALDKAKAEAADTTKVPDAKLSMRIAQLTKQLESVANLRMPISKAMLKGMQYAVQNVGEGGTITAWLPSSLAYGERGNRSVTPNEAVVMTVTLKEVSYGPTDEELAAKKIDKKLKDEALKFVKPEDNLKTNKTPRPTKADVVVRPVKK